MRSKQNVILIGIDALRADHLGCYGYHRNTSPHIDAFAARGTIFEKCFSQAPNTAPSFMSIMTSLYPSFHGITDIIGNAGAEGRAFVLDRNIPTLAETLEGNGYRTAAFTDGGQLHNKLGFERGFKYYSMNTNRIHSGEGSIPEADILYWIQEVRNDPFFLFFHTYAVHSPWQSDQKYWTTFDKGLQAHFSMKDFLKSTDILARPALDLYPYYYARVNRFIPGDVTYAQALYDSAILYVDTFLGKLFETLEKLHLDTNTTVILTADHGEEFIDHGKLTHTQLYNETLRVPLLVASPNLPRRKRITSVVRSIDIFPTILKDTGTVAQRKIQGTSLQESIEKNHELLAIAETESAGFSVQNSKYKYIYPRYKHKKKRYDELYDLVKDPSEHHNIALENLPLVGRMMQLFEEELYKTPVSRPEKTILYTARE